MIKYTKNEEIKMKRKTKIIIITLIFLGIVLSAISRLIISYFFEYDRETIEPDEETKICNIETQEFQSRKVFIVYPKDSKTDLTIMYFHGGSYMAEATKEHWDFIQKLAIDTNSTVIMPDYPLAPKANYKDVFDFAETLYKETINNIDTNIRTTIPNSISIIPITVVECTFPFIAKIVPTTDEIKHGNGAKKRPNIAIEANTVYINPLSVGISKTLAITPHTINTTVTIIGIKTKVFDNFL